MNLWLQKIKMSKLENALVWVYVKTWGKFGDHVIGEKDLWNFGADDLETAIMTLAFPRKRETTDRYQALTDLIMEKFEQDGMAFYEWAVKIHKEAIGPLLVDNQTTNSQIQQRVKILEWDSGMYFEPSNEYLSF